MNQFSSWIRDTLKLDQIKESQNRGFCYICGVKDHYSFECPLKDHRRLLFAQNVTVTVIKNLDVC